MNPRVGILSPLYFLLSVILLLAACNNRHPVILNYPFMTFLLKKTYAL